MSLPKDLKYTRDHEWAKLEGKTMTVGITDHAQTSLGDIVFVELPKEGRVLKAGETFGVVESVKAVSDLFSPVSGKVLAVNQNLVDDPSQINQQPYQSWMIKLELQDASEAGKLLEASAYQEIIQA